MKTRVLTNKLLGSVIIASAMAFAVRAGTFSSSTNAPIIKYTDIANIAPQTGSDKWWFSGANESGTTDAAKGQTFTNGPLPMLLKALTYKIDPTQKKTATPDLPTTYTVRVGTVSGNNFTEIARETFIQTNDTPQGGYMTWTFDNPVQLEANTVYGVDVAMVSQTTYQTGIPYLSYTAKANIPGVGYLYQSGDMGVGTNTITIDTGKSRVFHLDLAPVEEIPITITNQPADVTVNERGSATFSVSASGIPQFFQWYRQIGSELQPIAGAIYSTLTLNNVLPADSGVYLVVITNSMSAVTSAPVTLNVIPDTTPPRLLSAEGTGDMNRIYLVFSEPINSNSVGNLSNYSVQMTNDGPMLTILSASLYSSNIVVLETSDRFPSVNYIVRVSGITDTASISPNTMNPTSIWLKTEQGFCSTLYTPIIDPTDIANIAPQTGSDKWFFQSKNETNPADQAKGQTFTNGPSPMLLRALTYKIDPTQKKTATPDLPTTYTVRVGIVSGNNITVVASQVFTQTVNTPVGGYMTWVFNPPVPLLPNMVYGVDVGMVSQTDWTTGIPYLAYTGKANIPGVGYLYQSGDMGVGGNTISIDTSKSRVFHLDLVNPVQQSPQIILPPPSTITTYDTLTLKISVLVLGDTIGGDSYQWYYEGSPIDPSTNPTATNATLIITNLALNQSGNYYVRISNQFGETNSPVCHVTVIHDTTPPTIVSALGLLLATNLPPQQPYTMTDILVTFSEPVDPVTAEDLFNYEVYETDNPANALTVVTAYMLSPSNVLVRTAEPRKNYVNYTLRVNGITDCAQPAANEILPNTTFDIWHELGLITISDDDFISPTNTWKYDDSGTDYGPYWYTNSAEFFSEWMDGWQLFAATANMPTYVPELVRSQLTSPNVKIVKTHYFWKTFYFPTNADPSSAELHLRYIVDDGAIFYLNKKEFYAVGMPDRRPIYYTDFAARIMGNQFNNFVIYEPNTNGTAVIQPYYVVPNTNLKQGINELAVEVHQYSDTVVDSDMFFGMILTAVVPPFGQVVAPPTVEISPPVVANNKIRMTFATQSGWTYYLESIPKLGVPNVSWSVVTSVQGDGTVKTLEDDVVGQAQFYRLRAVKQ